MRKAIKSIIIVLSTFIIFLLGGCATDSEIKDQEAEVSGTEESADNGLEETPIYYAVGDTISTNLFEYKLTDLRFVDAINTAQTDKDSFFIPAKEGLIGGEGYKTLYYSFEYKFVGKDDLENRTASLHHMFFPTVQYQDYTIDNNFMIFWRAKGDDWYTFASDIPWSARENMGLDNSEYSLYSFQPLEDKEYEVRGTISVPMKAVEDTSSPLVVSFELMQIDGENNYSTEPYEFKIR